MHTKRSTKISSPEPPFKTFIFTGSNKNSEEVHCTKIQFPKALGTTDYLVLETIYGAKGFERLYQACDKKESILIKVALANGLDYFIKTTGYFIEYSDLSSNTPANSAIYVRFFFEKSIIQMEPM